MAFTGRERKVVYSEKWKIKPTDCKFITLGVYSVCQKKQAILRFSFLGLGAVFAVLDKMMAMLYCYIFLCVISIS